MLIYWFIYSRHMSSLGLSHISVCVHRMCLVKRKIFKFHFCSGSGTLRWKKKSTLTLVLLDMPYNNKIKHINKNVNYIWIKHDISLQNITLIK